MSSITEVARRAGVSPATASRVVSEADYPVSAATRERVLEAARELDYVPNALARGLLKSRVPVVAVIVHDITDPYFAEVVRGVEDGGVGGGLPRHHLLVGAGRGARAVVRPAAALDARRGGRVRGLRARRRGVERGDGPPPRRDARRRRRGRPPLAARRRRARGRRRQRGGDRGDGRGARRAGPPRDRVPRRAAVAVRRRGAAGGLPARARGGGDRATTSGSSSGRRSTRRAGRWASTRCGPAACRSPRSCCANDLLAIGALQRLAALGVDVPGEVSVAGFDDISTAALTAPGLSTVRLPLRDLGRLGFQHADAMLAGNEPAPDPPADDRRPARIDGEGL